MNAEPAPNALEVSRPGDELTEPEVMFAWQAIQHNPSAKAAAQAEIAHDEKLRALLRESIPVPASLAARLATLPPQPLTSAAPQIVELPRRSFLTWAGAAAALGVGALVWDRHTTAGTVAFEDWKREATHWAQAPRLALLSDQLGLLTEHLSAMGALVPQDIPRLLEDAPTIGCQELQVTEGKVSVVCFSQKGFAYHLFATSMSAVHAPAGFFLPAHPKLWTEQGWNFASWQTAPQALMLITQAPELELRSLFV